MNKRFRILVVDDEPEVRSVLKEFLTSLGYEIETASDGFEACHKIDLDIDLVLLDLMMPGMDGYEVLRTIRANPLHSELPIVVVTAITGVRERVIALEAGASDFLSKPIEFTELRARVASLLKMKQAFDQVKGHREELAATVANRTALLMRAIDDAVSAERRLQEAQLETIHRLVLATEYRDRDTAGHITRMSHFSAMLARLKGLESSDIKLILQASPMHDIGKISTPNEILLKPGKLDPDEWKVMQQHTIVGAQMLTQSSSKLLQVGETIALHHHERWDGNGYPNGIQGEQIPLHARICSIADVFDALTSVRPYKPAFSNDKSLEIIQRNAGGHFDPELVQIFIENIPEIEAIQNAAREMFALSNPVR